MTNMDPASNSSIRIVQFFILPEEKEKGGKHGSQVESKQNGNSTSPGKLKIDTNSNVSLTSPKTSGGPIIRCGELHIVLFPTSQWKHAKAFWQHTGMGISSRLADHCLDLLNKQRPSFDSNSPPASPRGRNRHYFSKSRSITSATEITETIANKMSKMDQLNVEENSYLEERYARNLPASAATDAKKTLKRRIAGVLLREGEHQPRCLIKESPPASPMIGPSTRGVANISEDDVFLLPGGMCAIWHSHQTLLKSLGSRKSICWG